jgi:formylglycine-generating enzyme required for sulfatase activity
VLSQGFALGTTPVTQVQWQAVMRDNPSHFRGDHLPVECVSWFDAIAFCNALSEKTARKPFYQLDAEHVTIVGGDGYRLPTEAEWEYACRAGATTVYSFGNDDDQLDAYAWYAANATGQTQAVAQRTPNAWGLFDMHGNVLEWCWDWFINYPPAEVTDPQGPSKGVRRVMRGGSWGGNPCGCRSAFRFRQAPNDRDQYIGFRVCFQPAPR